MQTPFWVYFSVNRCLPLQAQDVKEIEANYN